MKMAQGGVSQNVNKAPLLQQEERVPQQVFPMCAPSVTTAEEAQE